MDFFARRRPSAHVLTQTLLSMRFWNLAALLVTVMALSSLAASQATGDVVVTHYWITDRWVDKEGHGESETDRITHTWIRSGGTWQLSTRWASEALSERRSFRVWASCAIAGGTDARSAQLRTNGLSIDYNAFRKVRLMRRLPVSGSSPSATGATP